MLTLLSFLFALGLLIAIHEYGHYRVAVACGVKVLKFSIGFGKVIWRKRIGSDGTEFALSMLPLGGYVRMLDEREAEVPTTERHRAFNRQPVWKRASIVAAGPLANLLLAVSLYAAVSWIGVDEAQPILSQPDNGTLAHRAGLRGQDWVVATSTADSDAEPLASFEDLRWRLTQAALAGDNLRLHMASGPGEPTHEVELPLSELNAAQADANLLKRIGIVAPWSSPLIGEITPDGAAAAAGLRAGDLVLAVNEQAIYDAQQLRQWIRGAVGQDGRSTPQVWTVDRSGTRMSLNVTPKAENQEGQWVGRVGAYIGDMPQTVFVQAGLLEGIGQGFAKTWEVSALSVEMLWKMVTGEASLKNLSGPITIADYAGRSASHGLTSYLLFLALISVSLGVLNLLPLPVLDGGHLMYYLWESVTGRPVSDAWLERLQRAGVAFLILLMSLAVFNDIARLLG